MARKTDDIRKVLFDEPIRTDLPEVLGARLMDIGVHSALAEPAARFIADLYTEGLADIRLLGPAARNPDKAPEDLRHRLTTSARYLEHHSAEAMPFIERASLFLDKKIEEDAEETEAFEKNMARLEKAGRLENPRGLMLTLAPGSDDAETHGAWALDNIFGCLVKLVGIVELMRFERVSPTTLLNGMAEIHLDLTHRLRPGLLGNEEGRIGLLALLGSGAEAPAE